MQLSDTSSDESKSPVLKYFSDSSIPSDAEEESDPSKDISDFSKEVKVIADPEEVPISYVPTPVPTPVVPVRGVRPLSEATSPNQKELITVPYDVYVVVNRECDFLKG